MAITKADLLQRAIRGQYLIPSRSEQQDLGMHDRLYVEGPKKDVVVALSGRANQVLFGRRGTGKTMVLRTLLLGGRPTNPESDYAAILLESQDFMRSPDVLEKDPIPIKARAFFREFLNQFAERLLVVGDSVLRDRGLLSKLGLTSNARRKKLEDRLLRLNLILHYGVSIATLTESKYSEEVRTDDAARLERATQDSFEVGIKGSSLPRPDVRAKIGSSGEVSQTQGASVSKRYEVTGISDMGVPEMRVLLKELAELLCLNKIMILLDEWQSLRECQAEFAEHLKSCFFGLGCVSVKIAAYRHTSRFNNGGTRDNFRGLELGQDIAVAGDMDLTPSAQDTEPFFYQILYRRLLVREPDLAKFYGPIEQFDHTHLIRDLVASSYAGQMMVRGAHGVSRDFIEAFINLADSADADLARKKATLDDVNHAYGALSREVQQNIHLSDDVGGLLFEYIKPKVHETGAPFFFVSRQDDMWEDFLWELADKRAIHPLSSTDLPSGADVDWQGYEVSYGLFQEWRRAAAFSRKKEADNLNWRDPKGLTKNQFKAYVLDMKRKPPSLTRNCFSCNWQFSTGTHSYMVARLCPRCYKKQPD